jgi:hypothetical protein
LEISEKFLRTIVEKILRELLALNNEEKQDKKEKRDLYIVLPESKAEEEYEKFLEDYRKNSAEFNFIFVAPYNFKPEPESKIVLRNDIDFNELNNFTTFFPVVKRDTIAKAALLISDTFETKWIENSITKGERTILKASGIPCFSGKEPESYVNRFVSYIKDILSFGIEIGTEIKTEIKTPGKPEKQNYIQGNLFLPEKTMPRDAKKVITVSELYKLKKGETLNLGKGDIITDLAKEKAETMGIKIELIK